jgi:small subunit ribosomal protein S8
MASREILTMPSSRMKVAIARVLKDEGYVKDFLVLPAKKPELKITLKYLDGNPVIETITRVSKPSLRVYRGKNDLPCVSDGLGIAIISTSRGIMTDSSARVLGIGGEIICTVF